MDYGHVSLLHQLIDLFLFFHSCVLSSNIFFLTVFGVIQLLLPNYSSFRIKIFLIAMIVPNASPRQWQSIYMTFSFSAHLHIFSYIAHNHMNNIFSYLLHFWKHHWQTNGSPISSSERLQLTAMERNLSPASNYTCHISLCTYGQDV